MTNVLFSMHSLPICRAPSSPTPQHTTSLYRKVEYSKTCYIFVFLFLHIFLVYKTNTVLKSCAEYVSTCVLVNCRALTIGMGIMLIMLQRREIHVLKTIHKDAYFCISPCCARCKQFFSSSCLSVLVYFLVSLCYLSIMSHCRELEPPLRNSGSIQENMWN